MIIICLHILFLPFLHVQRIMLISSITIYEGTILPFVFLNQFGVNYVAVPSELRTPIYLKHR